MVASIPASAIVNVNPGVISAGGTGLDMVGLILTNGTRIPYGTVLKFSSPADVATYFGSGSAEAAAAVTYFKGYTNSFIKPAFMLFASYASAARAAFLRGGSLTLTLTQLQALSGTLTITTTGVALTSSSINLSSATSFSNAATIIQAAFTSPPFAVTYDPVAGAFVFTSTATGNAVTMIPATGSLAAGLALTAALGAVTSQGAAIDTPGPAMAAIIASTQDFVSFTTLFQASDSDIVLFATWTDSTNDRFMYVPWTTNSAAITNGDTTSPGALIKAAGLDGTAILWAPTVDKAVFVLGYGASIDFTRPDGRTVAAFRSGDGLIADVTNQTIAANLLANGYSFYGSYATANDQFTWLYNGQVSGGFAFIDSYLDQIWLNNNFQLTWMSLLAAVGNIPYNPDGYAMLESALLTNVQDALNFGAIRDGVTLTSSEISEINAIAGLDISDIMFSRGWYLSILDPGGTVRAGRGSPICTFFYTDGQSVQKINLSSLMVQ